jgi:hypothetical protein
MHIPRIRRILPARKTRHCWASLAILGCAAIIAACGSPRDVARTGGNAGPLLRFAQCMRAHGVPNFPDPSSNGGLIIPNYIDTDGPAFKSAQQACGHLARSGRQAGASDNRKLQLLALAKCMRAHAVPNFRDPSSSPPPPSSGNAIGGNGWYLSLGTAQERQSPGYKRAATACHLMIP